MKVALYARVSTVEQNADMQKKALIKRAEERGWSYELFMEQESTRKTRPVKYALYQRLLDREFDAVVVWKIDRWARSTQELSREVTTLFKKGVDFISLTDNIDLSSASGMLQFNIISAFAQFERDIISERTKEGMKGKEGVGKRGKDKGERRKAGYYNRWLHEKKKQSETVKKNKPTFPLKGRTKTNDNRFYIGDGGRWKLRSHIVMEKYLGRKINTDEVVHHKNNNSMDDRLENLEVWSIKQHNEYHRGKKRGGCKNDVLSIKNNIE